MTAADDLRAAYPSDICKCGDYQRDHKNGVGSCIHNAPRDITHGFEDCDRFRFSRHEDKK